MDLVDKFDFALTSLSSGSVENLRQEELIYSSSYSSESSSRAAIGYSVAEPIFKDIVDALESHFQVICAPMAKKMEFNMVNHFSGGVYYKDIYEVVLNNFKRVLGHLLSTYKNQGEVVINLTSDQVEIRLRDLLLKPHKDEMALYYKIKNNRFYNAQIRFYKKGKDKFYEVCLSGSWDVKKYAENNKEKIVAQSIKRDKRKGQWEKVL